MSPSRASTPRQTDWLTVSRNVTLTLECLSAVTSLIDPTWFSTAITTIIIMTITTKHNNINKGTRTFYGSTEYIITIIVVIVIIIMLMHILRFPNLLLPWRIRHSSLFPIWIILELWILQTAGRILWTGDQPRVWFQSTSTMFKRGKIFYVSERATTEIGHHVFLKLRIQEKYEERSIYIYSYMHYTWMMTDTYKTWLEIGIKEVI
jgi:hypothetical protein